MSNFKNRYEFIDFLNDTLIPDLKETGLTATAEDFEEAVKYMKAEPEHRTFLAIGFMCWGRGDTMQDAVCSVRLQRSRKEPNKKVIVYMFETEIKEALDEIKIDDRATTYWPYNVRRIEVFRGEL